MSYLDATHKLYSEVAQTPDVGLCCTTSPIWQLPGLTIPKIMQDMNYGCGTTVSASDLVGSPTILYVGVGGGMELLQFSYFSRKTNGVIGVDAVEAMLEACSTNLKTAQKENDWFSEDFIQLKKGDALNLPISDESVDIAAQNCLFNIFKTADLQKALGEMYRVLKPYGRLVMSDPICDEPLPDALRDNDQMRAACLSGAISLDNYIAALVRAGFATIEIRARHAYRVLSPEHHKTEKPIAIDSVEVCAIKDPMPPDGPCIFSGKTAIYYGGQPYLDDGKGHVLMVNQPLAVCDKTAAALQSLNEPIYISPSTYHYRGGGCC
ncbi:MAG: arsenosugar biosynthesis arsenite methyltransferase ArsM [Flavobacteriaceae bacterium]